MTLKKGWENKMIDKIKGKYRLICDICGEAAEEVFSTFDEAVDYDLPPGKPTLLRVG